MAITDIKLRATTHPPLTTKGSELTFADLDGNFIEIYDYLTAINSGGGVPAFSMATTYTGLRFVTYAGKIWMHISAIPSTGSIPGTNPAIWVETTIGALTHERNSDTALAQGTDNETSAAAIHDTVIHPLVEVTKDELADLIANEELKPGKLYKITDATTYAPVIVQAMTNSVISQYGSMVAQVPDPGQTVAQYVWSPQTTYTSGQLVAWQGHLYKNKIGANSNTASPDADTTNWELQTGSTQYVEYAMDCQIRWDSGILQILQHYDGAKSNQVGGLNLSWLPVVPANSTRNTADLHSDTKDSANLVGPVTENTWIATSLYFPLGGEVTLRDNRAIKSRIECADAASGTIQYCTLQNVTLDFLTGMDPGTNLESCTFNFQQETNLQIRANVGSVTGKKVGPEGSTIQDTIDLTGSTQLDTAQNGYPDIYGIFNVTSTNATENLDAIIGATYEFPLVVKPDPGLTITVNVIDLSLGAVQDQIAGNETNTFTLRGDYQDFMIVEPRNLSGTDYWLITKIVRT